MLISQKVLFCVGRTKEGPMLEEKKMLDTGDAIDINLTCL